MSSVLDKDLPNKDALLSSSSSTARLDKRKIETTVIEKPRDASMSEKDIDTDRVHDKQKKLDQSELSSLHSKILC